MTMQLTLAVHRARRLFPDKTAVVFAGRRWTWTQFADRVARLAGVLRDLGIGPGDRVAMLSHSSDRYLEFFFAAFWAGGIAVPVSTRYALPETAFLMQDCGAKVLLVGDDFLDMARYLIAGSMLAAAMQTLVPQSALLAVGQGPVISVVVMQALAFVLSVCSTVDAFLALAFAGTFTTGAVIAFLVFGPMVDIKSSLMFLGVFQRRAVAYLIALPLVLSLVMGVWWNLNLGW